MNQIKQKQVEILDGLVVKQAVRDIASKDPKTSNLARLYFESDDFSNLSERNNIDKDVIVRAVRELHHYPVLSKKKLAEDICSRVNFFFGLGSK
jgi:hypothetical protein|tara:strand:- start:1634 stop:1915 length:282 start_codon:yes stop_codon:yes gene_type:complete